MYLFFVRAFNDIDHMTPIVWKMSQDNLPVAVYCTNPEYDIQSDYRLEFLKSLGIEVDFLYNDFDQNLGRFHHVARFLMFRCFALNRRLGGSSKVLSRIIREAGKLLYSLLKTFFYRRQWADVMLVIGSSILIEALTLAKPVLYLKYLHANTTQYEEMGACWMIQDEDELKKALMSLLDNPGSIPYAGENVDQFLSEIIYGGHRHRDVLKDYEQFIVKGKQM